MKITELFSDISGLIKPDRITIDNFVFQLHSRITVFLLIAFSIIVTTVQYFGDPIECYTSSQSIPGSMLNMFCWITTTFSVPSSWRHRLGHEVPYPGMGMAKDREDRVYHTYYQWVCFVLYVQALMFAIPSYLWKMTALEKMTSLVMDLDKHIVQKERKSKCQSLVKFLMRSRGSHGRTFYCFVLLELMNAANVVVQMFMMDRFLGGNYWSFGLKFLKHRTSVSPYEDPAMFDPLIKVFPRMTKCTFHQFGPSGDVERHDALCLLSVNHVNEKIFIVIWFWFMGLLIASAIGIVYRIITYSSPDLRIIVLQARCRMASPLVLEEIVSRSSPGDWFLLTLLAKNLDGFNFKTVTDLYLQALHDQSVRSSSPPYATQSLHHSTPDYPQLLPDFTHDAELKVQPERFSVSSSFRPNGH